MNQPQTNHQKIKKIQATLKDVALDTWNQHIKEIDSKNKYKLSDSAYLGILLIEFKELIEFKKLVQSGKVKT